MHPYLDHPGPIPFAHRGGASEAPENTLPAFQHAWELGFRYLETDVHATADGVLVAFHDTHLDRVTDRTGAIAELPWAEVSKARVAGREPIPLLTDLLEAFPDARLNIDAKADPAVEPLARVLHDTASLDRVCVGSFSDRRIARMRDLCGGALCTAMGPRQTARLVAASWGAPSGPFTAQAAQIPMRHGRVALATPRLVRAAHGRGIHVHIWTIDEPAHMETLLDIEVDGIMTDRPAVLRHVLSARGLWV